jgi:hypothetical protein
MEPAPDYVVVRIDDELPQSTILDTYRKSDQFDVAYRSGELIVLRVRV